MRVLDPVRRSAVAVRPDQSLVEAASVLNKAGVGALAVVDADRRVGIVTDRDLVSRDPARVLPLDARIDGVMTSPVVTVDADYDSHAGYQGLRTHASRRLPVVRRAVSSAWSASTISSCAMPPTCLMWPNRSPARCFSRSVTVHRQQPSRRAPYPTGGPGRPRPAGRDDAPPLGRR
jgi:hypothetical protein